MAKEFSTTILWCEAIAFAVLIALAWLNEVISLPRLFFSGEHTPNWRESTLETCVVVLVAIPVLLLTRRLLARLHYVEGLLHLCAWCKKVNYDGQWIGLEKFFHVGLAAQTSHGMCPECLTENAKNL
jgi:hypothetical protein